MISRHQAFGGTGEGKMADVARKFDDVLRNLAGQAGSLETLLSVFFSFLYRNTDFYVTFDPAKTFKPGMGFPPGRAEQLLLRAFRSFPYKPYGSVAGGGGSGAPKSGRRADGERGLGGKKVPSPAVGSGAGLRTGTGGRGDLAPVSEAAAAERASTRSSPASIVSPSRKASEDAVAPSSSVVPVPAPAAARSTNPTTAAGGMRVRYTDDGKQIPIGNGGVTPRYYWTQTVTEATVYVDVPPGTRSKDVSCVIQPRRLRLKVRGAGKAAAAAAAAAPGAQGEPGVAAKAAAGADGQRCEHDEDVIFDGALPSTVSREDSMWSLNDGKTVVISFEKTMKSWWKSVVEGDPEIDTSQVTLFQCCPGERIKTLRLVMLWTTPVILKSSRLSRTFCP